MTKTAQDVLTRAFRRIGVTSPDENLEAEYYANGVDVMQGIMDELVDAHGATISWTVNTVPDGLFLPMAYAVAVDIAPDFGMPAPEPRSRALIRLRASLLPDDRKARADLDDDGSVSDDEMAADERAQFY